ncbi:MAG: FAD-dependent oxidoreductase, partial [Gemmatimonadaceae bacterium]|nr:FAD-dependent oxidoreductase [Gemmatimonadaceae bacterium]
MSEQQITLRIEGMTCLDCARTLERELGKVEGVRGAEVSYATGRAHVAAATPVDAEKLTAALVQAVEGQGYRAVPADVGPDERPAARASSERPKPAARGRDGASAHEDDADYDLVVIGTGAAGMAAAIRASELGATAAIVEGGEVVGGTCVNTGCIPSKYLIEAAQRFHDARRGAPGIAACEPALAWNEVLRDKRELVGALRQEKYVDVIDAYAGVTLLRGRAELLGGGRVRIAERVVRGGKIVVATGARPAVPPINGLELVDALDSTSVMELERLPSSLVVLGGGSIGLELGQAFSRFGVRVVVVEAADRILPSETLGVSETLTKALVTDGMEFHVGTLATRVERIEGGVRLHVSQGSLAGIIEAERLLVATGRRPNVEATGLESAGVRLDPRGFIAVDEYMRTSNPDVFAAGDVTGGPGYVYVAAL